MRLCSYDRSCNVCFKQILCFVLEIMLWIFALSCFFVSELHAQEIESTETSEPVESSHAHIPEPGPANFLTPPSSKEEAVLQLRSMIEKNYEHWTGGRSRPLTLETIGHLEKNPKLTYGQAVLLGVLALTIDHAHGFIDRLDFNSIMALANGESIQVNTSPELAVNAPYLIESPTYKYRNLVTNYRKFFKNLVSNITPDGYKLWGSSKGPSIAGLQQGPVGDCYWLSAVEAVVMKHPEIVTQTIKQLGPDKFELNFRGYKEPLEVTLTHAEMSQLSLDPQQGCWLTVLALGEAKIRNQEPDLPEFWRQTPLGVVAHSGSQKQVFELLSGKKYVNVHLPRRNEQVIAAILSRTTREQMPVGLSTSDHCLSICDYNPDTKMLKILNPAGTSDEYQISRSGLSVSMKDGIFEMSLSDVCRAFSALTVPAASAP